MSNPITESGFTGETDDSYVLIPLLEEPGAYLALFQDGSYTRWIPPDARF